ncbi:MAG: ATP-binding protein [Deltaproteobacteria bacterium]|jgi:AAA+ superfamily predicted ATPase|nr:ATP-binding protein [Deltaproteobacteria bacterium]
MATAEQIKSLIRAFSDNDEENFKSVVLQIAAYEAKDGNVPLARELKAELAKASGTRAKTRHLRGMDQSLLTVTPHQRLRDLIAPDDLRERIRRVLRDFIDRRKLERYGMFNRRKILLAGHPGTGKTLTAHVIATELHLPLFVAQMDKPVTRCLGKSGARLRKIFDCVNNVVGVYLFDDFEAIGSDRSPGNEVGETRGILNPFLRFLGQQLSHSIVIVTTDNTNILDKALLLRFDDVLRYHLPSKTEIERLFSHKLGAFDPKFKPSPALLSKASPLSHAEISRICGDAIKEAILTDQTNVCEEVLLSLLEERLTAY